MLFSSLSFLFFFFPLVLILYYLVIYCIGRTAGNLILFCSSIFFYAWGEPQNVLILLASICFNYSIVKCIERGERFKKIYLIFSITVNLAVLFIFKYLNFTLNNLKVLGFNENIQMKEIVMPIGISFYTFQALSYLIDVYRGRVKSQNTLLGVGLYIAFFPQLVAGPIVQYQTIEEQITNRKENWDKVCQGVSRFVIGLSKKVILANSFAIVADERFENVGGGIYPWHGSELYFTLYKYIMIFQDILIWPLDWGSYSALNF